LTLLIVGLGLLALIVIGLIFRARPVSSERRETQPATKLKRIHLPGTDTGCYLEVHGEASYQPALQRARETNGRSRESRFFVAPEFDNPHDENAVMVMSEEGETIGYLTAADAPRYRQTLVVIHQRGEIGQCRGQFVGGTKAKPTIGVWLDIVSPTQFAATYDVKYKRVTSRQKSTPNVVP
jgi:hypothetical protein